METTRSLFQYVPFCSTFQSCTQGAKMKDNGKQPHIGALKCSLVHSETLQRLFWFPKPAKPSGKQDLIPPVI